jgi:SMC interacting uncharacterized protein involved in chromosome segregation
VTKTDQIEIEQLERELDKLNRAMTNQSLAASQQGSPGWQEALERIARAKNRISELRGESHG